LRCNLTGESLWAEVGKSLRPLLHPPGGRGPRRPGVAHHICDRAGRGQQGGPASGSQV